MRATFTFFKNETMFRLLPKATKIDKMYKIHIVKTGK